MFHWHHGDRYVVLTDEEELDLVRQFTDSPLERVKYHTSRATRKAIERRMLSYLNDCASTSPEEFDKQYVLRSASGPAALLQLRVLLEAYARITRLAVYGNYGGGHPIADDERIEAALAADGEQVVHVTLLGGRRWPWQDCVPIGRLGFPLASIQKVVGRPHDFLLLTASANVHFGPTLVRVTMQGAA
jgi:hypothetical protein